MSNSGDLCKTFQSNFEHNLYRSKAKNAQEAHEAIRPTDPTLSPNKLPSQMPEQNKQLYDLIWRRTLATQMSESVSRQVVFRINMRINHPEFINFETYQASEFFN